MNVPRFHAIKPLCLLRNKTSAGRQCYAEEEIKSPFVLEFLGLKDEYSETDLEEALINHLGAFLLELGAISHSWHARNGFDWMTPVPSRSGILSSKASLSFAHRFKDREFTHADAGQMHLYLNYARGALDACG